MGVPNVFGGATTSIPLSQLDANFNTTATLGNTAIGLGNVTTSVGNLTLTNVTINSGTINAAVTQSGFTGNAVIYSNTSGNLTTSANLTFNGTTLTVANDASISGLTVGKGTNGVTANTALGSGALLGANSGSGNNTAIGYQSSYSNTSGSYNTSVGQSSLYTNTTGLLNVALGQASLYYNTTGGYNVAVGPSALSANTTASNNTAVGYQAGYAVTTGTGNVLLGLSAGANITTGANNIFIGGGYNTASSATVSNEIVIATGNQTGKGTNTGFIIPNGGGVYQGNNSAAWSVTSDRRLKKNIVDNNTGLNIINQIQIRNFEYRLPEEITEVPQDQAIKKTGVQLGVIAQEIAEVSQEFVKTETTGVMSVDQDNLTWYLINAVKELNAKVTALEAQLGK
jgi:hypothetical protein